MYLLFNVFLAAVDPGGKYSPSEYNPHLVKSITPSISDFPPIGLIGFLWQVVRYEKNGVSYTHWNILYQEMKYFDRTELGQESQMG